MAAKFLVSLDVSNPPSWDQQGLDLKTLSFIKRIHISASPSNLQDVSDFVYKNSSNFLIYCDCTEVDHSETIFILLHNGCTKAVVTETQFSSIVEAGLLQTEHHDRFLVVAKGEQLPEGYVWIDQPTVEAYTGAVEEGEVVIIPSSKLTACPSQYPQLYPIHQLITAILKSDRPDGLWPTIVANEYGVSLGLVYSNEQSVQHALETGKGAYYSRSKKGLWVKGLESGDTQELVEIDWDCDADALQFKVKQKGSGAHHLRVPPLSS